MVIYWSVTGPKCGKRTGTVLEHKGESWTHMVRWLARTEPEGFLIAYRDDYKGNPYDYYEIALETEDATQAESWFSGRLVCDNGVA